MTISRSKRPRFSKGGIDNFRDIRSPDDNHLSPRNHAIHKGEQLGDDPLFHIAQHFGPFGRDSVDFVDKDDAGGLQGCLFKDLPQSASLSP